MIKKIKIIVFFIFLFCNIIYSKDKTFIPIVFSTTELGLGVGLNSVFTYNEKDSLSFTGFLTSKGNAGLFLNSERIFYKKYQYLISAKILDFPTNFYGIGNNTKFLDKKEVTLSLYEIDPSILKQVKKNCFVGLTSNIGIYDIGDSDKIEKFSSYSGYKKYSYAGLGPIFTIDTRDNKFYPYSGIYLKFESLFFLDDFNKQELEYLYFKKILKTDKKIIWASRYKIENASKNFPIWLYPEVDVRGIEGQRFTDKISFNTEQEMRFPIYKKWKGSVFVGAGKVSHDFSKLNLKDIKIGSGFGIRYSLSEESRINLGIDFAFHNINDDDQNSYFYFKVLEKF